MISILLVVLWVEEGAIALTAIMHGGHLIVTPGLTIDLLTTRSAATSIELAALKLLRQPTVHE